MQFHQACRCRGPRVQSGQQVFIRLGSRAKLRKFRNQAGVASRETHQSDNQPARREDNGWPAGGRLWLPGAGSARPSGGARSPGAVDRRLEPLGKLLLEEKGHDFLLLLSAFAGSCRNVQCAGCSAVLRANGVLVRVARRVVVSHAESRSAKRSLQPALHLGLLALLRFGGSPDPLFRRFLLHASREYTGT